MTSPIIEEARRRLPSIRLIEDRHIREQTAQVAARAPLYFWSVPASSSGYHHPLCRGERGLWIHSLMVSTVVERLVHDADMVASTSTISPAVPAPIPEELADVDGLEEVDLR